MCFFVFCFDTDCEGLAVRLVSLATMFCNRGLTYHVIITRLMPRFGIPRCLLAIIQGNTMREKKDRYFSMYSAKNDWINMELKHSTRAFESISFWNHNGKFDGDRAYMRAKFNRDDIHLPGSHSKLQRCISHYWLMITSQLVSVIILISIIIQLKV